MAATAAPPPAAGPTLAVPPTERRGAQKHVRSACYNCKRSHLACDDSRPCQRCVRTDKRDSCRDVQSKKRGRPRTKDGSAPGRATGQPLMEAHLFQFSLSTVPETSVGSAIRASLPSPPTPCSTAYAEPIPDCVRSTTPSTMNTACPRPAAFLFLTSDLRCLRIEEPGGARALLGHSLVSVVNRSVSDFVCDHDWPRLQLALEAARLAPRRCLAPPPIDPGAFQDLPLARLIHPVPATSGDSTVRAHLRTQSGSYRLFDICVYAGTTPELGQAYVVCCITPFDVLDSLPAPLHGAWTPTAVPPAKRHCASLPTATPSPDALYLLATVTDGDAACTAGVSAPAPPTPALSTPSPSLAAFTPRLTPLPSLSAMLKAIGAGSPPAPQ